MSPLQKLQSRLALADAAFTGEKEPLTINLHQNAVAGDHRGQLRPKVGNQVGAEGGGCLVCAQNGHIVLLGHVQALLVHRQTPANEQSRDLIVQQPVENDQPLLRCLLIQVAPLHVPQDLQPPGLEMVKIACQAQARPGHVLYRNADRSIVCGGVNDLHMEFFFNCGKGHIVFAHDPSLLPVWQPYPTIITDGERIARAFFPWERKPGKIFCRPQEKSQKNTCIFRDYLVLYSGAWISACSEVIIRMGGAMNGEV